MVWSRRKTLTTYHREHLYGECIAPNSASASIFIHVYIFICQQQLQAGLDIHEGLNAQKYIGEMVRPQVKPHVDNPALGDSTAFMRGGAKPHTARISQDVLASVINLQIVEQPSITNEMCIEPKRF